MLTWRGFHREQQLNIGEYYSQKIGEQFFNYWLIWKDSKLDFMSGSRRVYHEHLLRETLGALQSSLFLWCRRMLKEKAPELGLGFGLRDLKDGSSVGAVLLCSEGQLKISGASYGKHTNSLLPSSRLGIYTIFPVTKRLTPCWHGGTCLVVPDV